MKLKKQLASLAAVGMLSVAAAASAFASGVGYVNFDTLVQAHKDFPKVSAQMQSAIKDANEQFAKRSKDMKTDQEKQNLGKELAQNLSKLENSLIVPIEKDVVAKVEQVRQNKGYDAIVAQGAIIAGSENATDETQTVAQLLK
ncbi:MULTISPECIES: OmpH family outer membrane protein [Megasphaera]|uniref:Outer membrane protein, OmpH-like domain protein n=1 Tax=Megasphaera vaginalis (ex Srinivasan et al. 2021) TaxID=1111454 RepID=U7UJN6_9FIRM|nr:MULTISPECIES: OmpH family outer membrane protein [Megasphaera]ERT58653.1 outer membrane protein, OmpH-like domain protein [Megasphaera vaginalis (ex Srinivasan et al. 2021)]